MASQFSELFNNIKSIDDYKQAREAFEQEKRLKNAQAMLYEQKALNPEMGGNLPATLQIADALRKARESGDTTGYNDILLSGKIYDKGLVNDEFGNVTGIPDYNKAKSQQVGAIKAAETQADQLMKNMYEPERNRKNEFNKAMGKEEGEGVAELKDRLASLPQLENVVNKLSDLGKKATYTYIGQFADSAQRQAGMDTGEGAVARKEYISYVDNQVLPLLRQTFGAQFTLKEGENLKVTLGDPNATPEEKDAVLRSFIETKKDTINSKERQYGMPETTWETGGVNGVEFPVAGEMPGEQVIMPNAVNQEFNNLKSGFKNKNINKYKNKYGLE